MFRSRMGMVVVSIVIVGLMVGAAMTVGRERSRAADEAPEHVGGVGSGTSTFDGDATGGAVLSSTPTPMLTPELAPMYTVRPSASGAWTLEGDLQVGRPVTVTMEFVVPEGSEYFDYQGGAGGQVEVLVSLERQPQWDLVWSQPVCSECCETSAVVDVCRWTLTAVEGVTETVQAVLVPEVPGHGVLSWWTGVAENIDWATTLGRATLVIGALSPGSIDRKD